jgi:hypothetical protein
LSIDNVTGVDFAMTIVRRMLLTGMRIRICPSLPTKRSAGTVGYAGWNARKGPLISFILYPFGKFFKCTVTKTPRHKYDSPDVNITFV